MLVLASAAEGSRRPAAQLALAALWGLAWGPVGVLSQFGGGGFGGGGFGGGGGYNPPPPNCPAFKCGKNEMPVGKVDHQLWSHGCKDSGLSFMNTGSFDPNNPLKSLQQKSVNKCCIERDICKQTCGMTANACHDNFQKCSKKICKGDQNCEMQAMLSEIMSDPYDEADKDPKKKYDPEESRCRGYNRGQKEACQCVPKAEWQEATNSKLSSFYKKFNPEKLDKSGEIKDLDEVWKKWKGKEKEMFLALATKYKDKAVEIRVKPTPPPYTPPPASDGEASAAAEDASEAPAPPPEEPAEAADPEAEAFESKRFDLVEGKKKAAADEDYDLAQSLKDELRELSKKESERLKSLKAKAIEDEDFVRAKAIKSKLAKMEDL